LILHALYIDRTPLLSLKGTELTLICHGHPALNISISEGGQLLENQRIWTDFENSTSQLTNVH
jgi:hypothetical protein